MKNLVLSAIIVIFGFLNYFGGTHALYLGAGHESLSPDQEKGIFELLEKFENFQVKFDKKYGSVEEKLKRFKFFTENLKNAELNEKEKGAVQNELNEKADWSRDELSTQKADSKHFNDENIDSSQDVDDQNVPSSFDWRRKNAVTPVKEQKKCNASWAFSTAALIESCFAIHNGSLFDLSAQQLIDCDKKSEGCKTGSPENAIRYAINKEGLMRWKDYPYIGKEGGCRFKPNHYGVKVKEIVKIKSKDEKAMARYIASKGPVLCNLHSYSLSSYKEGIMMGGKKCSREEKDADYSVLIVGYGTAAVTGTPLWIVKNSLGSQWGEDGYFRMYRGDNVCGIANNCTSVVLG